MSAPTTEISEDEKLRCAVAEACGKRVLRSCGERDDDHNWKDSGQNSIGAWVRTCSRCDASRTCSAYGHDTFWSINRNRFELVEAPDYPNDQNAMDSAIATLTPDERCAYASRLYVVAGKENGLFGWAFATARQRARVFVEIKTEGKA